MYLGTSYETQAHSRKAGDPDRERLLTLGAENYERSALEPITSNEPKERGLARLSLELIGKGLDAFGSLNHIRQS